MIECYFKYCEHHYQDEPFCSNMKCSKSKEEIDRYIILRKEELEQWEKKVLDKKN